MRRLLICCLLLLSVPVFAAPVGVPVTLELKAVTVTDLSRLLFADMLHVPYFVAPDVLSDSRKLSLSLSGQTSAQAFDTIKAALLSIGVDVKLLNGVYFVSKLATPERIADSAVLPVSSGVVAPPVAVVEVVEPSGELISYVPRYRPLAYLSNIARFAGAVLPQTGVDGSVLVYSVIDKHAARVVKALAAADVAPRSVTIKAALIEYTQASDKEFALGLDVLTKRLAVAYHPAAALANGVLLKGATIQAVFSAIKGDSRFSYTAHPQILVVDGEKASLSVGQDVPVLGSVSFTQTGTPVQSITYRPSGVSLHVTPRISADSVSLMIEQETSSFSPTTSSNINSPTMLKRSVKSVVSSKVGQLVVLAGLDEDKDSDSKNGLSFLPDFLHSSIHQVNKTQMLLMFEIVDSET